MPLPVAQLLVNIGANATQAEATMTGLAAKMGASGMLGIAAVGAGAVVAGVGVIATKMAGDFESSMTSIVTGAGESADKLTMLKAGVLDLAKQTGTSTEQLVAGLYMIESGGFRAGTALDILKAAAEGAKVGNADLGVVADATDTILKNYGEHGMTAANAVNTLIATVAHGKTHMEEFSDSLAHVLPTAASAGIGLNDVMGAMATMTGQGTHAAEAATYLRQMIVALSAPGDQAKRVLESVGLSADKVAKDMHTSLPMAIAEITEAVGKKFPIGSAGYVAAMREIAGGSRQMQGMLQLGGDHVKTFTQLTKDVAGQVQKGGSSIEGWTLVQQTFNQKMSQAGEHVKVLFIQLGEKLLPIATRFAEWLGGTAVPAIQRFASWISGSGDKLAWLRPILIGVAIAIAGALVAAFISWAISAAAAAVATIAATWPILAIGAAIALLVAGIIWAVTHWHDITTALGHFKDMIAGAPAPVKLLLAVLFPIPALIALIVSHWTDITTALGHFMDMLGDVLGHIGEFFGKAVAWFENLEIQVGLHIRQMALDFVAKIIELKTQIIHQIEHLVKTNVDKILFFRTQVINHIKQLATDFNNALGGLPGKMLDLGKHLLEMFAQGLRNGRNTVINAVKDIPVIGGLAGGINNLIPHFATGGVMGHEGMALVGENGPELVRLPGGAQITPLPAGMRGSGAFSGGGGGTQTIVVQLVADGRKLAEVTLPHMHTVIRNATGVRR